MRYKNDLLKTFVPASIIETSFQVMGLDWIIFTQLALRITKTKSVQSHIFNFYISILCFVLLSLTISFSFLFFFFGHIYSIVYFAFTINNIGEVDYYIMKAKRRNIKTRFLFISLRSVCFSFSFFFFFFSLSAFSSRFLRKHLLVFFSCYKRCFFFSIKLCISPIL